MCTIIDDVTAPSYVVVSGEILWLHRNSSCIVSNYDCNGINLSIIVVVLNY